MSFPVVSEMRRQELLSIRQLLMKEAPSHD